MAEILIGYLIAGAVAVGALERFDPGDKSGLHGPVFLFWPVAGLVVVIAAATLFARSLRPS